MTVGVAVAATVTSLIAAAAQLTAFEPRVAVAAAGVVAAAMAVIALAVGKALQQERGTAQRSPQVKRVYVSDSSLAPSGSEEFADHQVQEAMQRLQGELSRRGMHGFSPEAQARLLDQQLDYFVELGRQAIVEADRHGNEQVQRVNVEEAETIIGARDAVKRGFGLTFGGLAWGGALSQTINEMTAKDPRMAVVAAGVTVLVVATGVLMWSLKRVR